MTTHKDTMEKRIAHIRYKMMVVVGLILLLGTWQFGFILEGIRSHVEMNSTILGTFAFSIVVAFIFVFKLDNEVAAFNALKEMWSDIQNAPAEDARDPHWKHRRCTRPARIFQRPRLLGHAYELVVDEVARTKKIRVSIETMNTLVHTIEQSINEEKSMVVYLSGLLVFMGLIGTFIGLLQMVGAIGGIIGSLAQSGGGAGASTAFQELLGALQEPLKGMASGFASSLFGLFSSLVVGLLGRFAGQAAGVLKGEFESWLASVVQISEGNQQVASGAAPAAKPAAVSDTALIGLIGNVLEDYARVSGAFGLVARRLDDLRVAQEAQTQLAQRMIQEFGRLQQGQERLQNGLDSSLQIGPAINDLGARVTALGNTVSNRIAADMTAVRGAMEDIHRSQAAGLRQLSANQAQTAAYMTGAVDQLSAEIDRRAAAPSAAQIEAALERSLTAGLTELCRVVNVQADRQDLRLQSLHGAQIQTVRELAATVAASAAPAATPAQGETLAAGLDRLNETLSTAFSAYSSLLHVAVAALDKAERARSPAVGDRPESASAGLTA